MESFWRIVLGLNLVLLTSSTILYVGVALPTVTRSVTLLSIVINAVIFVGVAGFLRLVRLDE